ncbi:hypothetical protein [Spiroplasma endosymbiont of 'Nebria riversi']|nr:hypothetical protein [Spiroplasma endosymbiont of 'Nebria riversi']
MVQLIVTYPKYKHARRELENKRGHFLMLKVGKRISTMDYCNLLIMTK